MEILENQKKSRDIYCMIDGLHLVQNQINDEMIHKLPVFPRLQGHSFRTRRLNLCFCSTFPLWWSCTNPLLEPFVCLGIESIEIRSQMGFNEEMFKRYG